MELKSDQPASISPSSLLSLSPSTSTHDPEPPSIFSSFMSTSSETNSGFSSAEDLDDSATETDSDSLCTLTESLAAALLVERGGKTYSSYNEECRLPFDDLMRQAERLTNLMVLNLWDGYWEPEEEKGYVARLLNAGGRVLDVGSGMEGLWLVRMGQLFPNSECVGLDLAPTERSFTPPLVRYEVWDVTEGIPYPEEYFDVVHIRGTTPFIASFPDLLVHIRRVLSPGGVLLMSEHGCEVHDHSGTSLDWFTISVQHAFNANGEVSATKFDPRKGAKEFQVLKQIVEESGRTQTQRKTMRNGGVKLPDPDGFSQVYETIKEIHLGTREESDEDPRESQISIQMRAIVIAHWMVQMLQLDGTAAASETLQAQVALLTERDSGLFQIQSLCLYRNGGPGVKKFELTLLSLSLSCFSLATTK
ncbi:S-adenosyl-L-methionine-dependent methyltransferase [Mrakia frigida]|uniref:class I SAM-dependent methyltransferase n=1 Tax=Mrakia frigida TaxID=29902 RepID=UPI003FCC201D